MTTKETCKTCTFCAPSYKGGYCELKDKKVSYNGACNQYSRKSGK